MSQWQELTRLDGSGTKIRFVFTSRFHLIAGAEVGIKIPMKEIKVNGQSVSGMEMNQIYGAGSYMIEGTVC